MTQIFIEPELENLSEKENAEQWFAICSELGLNKQLAHADKSEEKQAPPYMYIDPKSEHIIRTLCPRLINIEEYSASTIPLDVLQEVQKCKKHDWYSEIKIAYDDKSPDPFVIGYTKDQHSWQRHKHLIARWGSELLPFEELEKKAIARLRDDATEAMADIKAKAEIALQNVDLFIKGVLNGKGIPSINFSVNNLTGW